MLLHDISEKIVLNPYVIFMVKRSSQQNQPRIKLHL